MTGKIVFTAPSRPLVVQQIEACHNIVGIPQVRIFFNISQLEDRYPWPQNSICYPPQGHIFLSLKVEYRS